MEVHRTVTANDHENVQILPRIVEEQYIGDFICTPDDTTEKIDTR